MSLVETYLPQPVFVFSIQCVTQRSRLRVLLHFADNTYSFGVFVSVWQTAMSPVLNLIAAQQAVFEPRRCSLGRERRFENRLLSGDEVQYRRHSSLPNRYKNTEAVRVVRKMK